MPTTASASTTVTPAGTGPRARDSSARTASARPTRVKPKVWPRAAASAPAMTARGPQSPPMASMAMRSIGRCGSSRALRFFDLSDLAAPVEAAVRADPVWQLRLMALRALAHPDRLEGVVGPAPRRAGFRVSSLWIRHALNPSVRSSNSGGLPPQCVTSLPPRPDRVRSAPRRGSTHRSVHPQADSFRFAPHAGQSPRHVSEHNGFIGSAR